MRPRKPPPARSLAAPADAVGLAEIEACYHHAPLGMCVLDREFRYVRINERLAEINGPPVAAHIGRTVREVIPKIAPIVEPMLRKVLRKGQPIMNFEVTGETPAHPGEIRHWVAGWHPLRNKAGQIVAISCLAFEITERKRAEAERDKLLETLDGERRRLAAVLEQLPVGVIIAEAPDGRIVLANEAAARIHRQPAPETGGIRDYRKWKVLHLDGRPLRPNEYPLARAIRSGATAIGEEYLIKRGDGTRGGVSVNAAPIRDSRGEIVAGAVTIADVTLQRETLNALRESEARFRHIAENSPFGLGSYDAQHRVIYVNPKLTELVGYTERDLPRVEDWFEALYPDPKYRHAVATQWGGDIEQVRSGELRHSPVREYRAVCRDGTVKILEITFVLEREMTHAVFQDITDRKRAEAEILSLNVHLEERVAERTAQLDAANRELREEIGERQRLQSQLIEVSEREQRRLGEGLHDMLGQQLTGLGMMASVLERELRRERHAGAESVARLGAMLKDAVKAARELSRGFYPVVLEQGGLLLALKDLAASTQSVSGVRCRVWHRASFRFAAEAGIHLYRIAQEAVTNALKHGAPREIRLELTARRGRPVLRILNDGRAWRPPRSGHAGLGMHIVRHRAELIGAEITIERGQPGGCVVTCVLPGKSVADL